MKRTLRTLPALFVTGALFVLALILFSDRLATLPDPNGDDGFVKAEELLVMSSDRRRE